MANYVKEEFTDPDRGDVEAKEGPSQNKDEYCRLHWISHVSSLKTPKDMFDAMNNLYEGDLENSTQGCEGIMSEKIQ